MKVAYLLNKFPELSQTFILNQITGLKDNGLDVDIFSAYPGNGSLVHEDVEKYKLLGQTIYYKRIPKNKIKRLFRATKLVLSGLNKKPAAVLNSLNLFRYGRQAANLNLLYKTIPFTKDNYDIIHSHFGPNGNFAVFLKDLGAIDSRIVTTFHGYDMRLAENREDIYKELFQKGDLFIAISPYNYKMLVDLGADEKKIVYHPVGIDLERFSPDRKITEDKRINHFRFVTVARLVKEKGLVYGIKAIKRVCKAQPDISLEYNIIGDGELKKELNDLIHSLHLEKTVRLLGARNQGEIISILKNSHIFILPSVAEALPVVLMEAHALELPIIATDVGSVDQIVLDGESGYIVKKEDDEALANRISLFLKKPEKLKEMGRKGRKRIEGHYNIKELNVRLINIFRELLAGNA